MEPKSMPASSSSATILGIIAVVFWSTSVAFVRSLSKNLGPFTTASCNYLFSGVIALIWLACTPGGFGHLRKLSRKYLLGCGGLFVVYTVAYYLAVGLAATDAQVLEVGLINYLWPCLTMLLAVPLLGKRGRWYLIPGTIVAFAGVVLATMQKGSFSAGDFLRNIGSNWLPYFMALIAAVSWGLYSNLCRRWGGEDQGGGVPLFFLASGTVILGLKLLLPVVGLMAAEQSTWTRGVVFEFILMMLFTTVMAYMFWDFAMRRGNVVLVAAVSYSTPLVSTVISCLYLGVGLNWQIGMAAIMVVIGAVVCKMAVQEGGVHKLTRSQAHGALQGIDKPESSSSSESR